MTTAPVPSEAPKDRIRQRLLALGYVRVNGKPDVARFARDHGYNPSYVHHWLNGRHPKKYLPQLARDLKTTQGYLLLGEGGEADIETSAAPPVVAVELSAPDFADRVAALKGRADEHLESQESILGDMLRTLRDLVLEVAAQRAEVARLGRVSKPTAQRGPKKRSGLG